LRNKADPRECKISGQSEQSIACNSAYHSPYHLLCPFLGVYFFFHRPLLISTRCGFPYRSRTIFMPTTRSNRMSASCSPAKTRRAFQSRKERLRMSWLAELQLSAVATPEVSWPKLIESLGADEHRLSNKPSPAPQP
jgi:hypothetical protein